MKVGLIACTGGSVFAQVQAVAAAKGITFEVVTDRPCGIEEVCRTRGVSYRRIADPDRDSFSRQALTALSETGAPTFVLLFFLRLVGSPLTRALPVVNLHPSLLPAYKGFHAVARQKADGRDHLGATAHLATSDADSGPIIAQTRHALSGRESLERLNALSFVQKVELSLSVLDLFQRGAITVDPVLETVTMVAPIEPSQRCFPAPTDRDFRRLADDLYERWERQEQ